VSFDVFISYSRTDRLLARSLHLALERVEVPVDAVGLGTRLYVFRDETDIRGTRYYDSIDSTLRSSRKLLVVCSPAARKSDFVNDEIQRFLGHHSLTDVIPVIAVGLPNNATTSDEMKAFPELLGDTPLAADLSTFEPRRNRLQDREWEPAWHLILANVFDLPRSALDKRSARIREETGRAEALRLIDQAIARAAQGRAGETLLHIATAHSVAPPSTLRSSLHLSTMNALPELVVDDVLTLPARPTGCVLNGDGSIAVTWGADNTARMIDAASNKILAEHVHPDVLVGCTFLADGSAATYSRSGSMAVLRRSGDRITWNAPEWVSDLLEYPTGGLFAYIRINGRVCQWSPGRDEPIILADQLMRRGEPISPKATFSADGMFLLVTDGSTLIAVDSNGKGAVVNLASEYMVHQACHALGGFLVSDGTKIYVLTMDPPTPEASLVPIAADDAGVTAATFGPELERLAYLDARGRLILQPALPRRSEGRETDTRRWRRSRRAPADEPPRSVVQPPPGVESLAWWNGDAVVIALGGTACAAFGASTGDVLWTRSFDRKAALGGVTVHAGPALLSHIDMHLSRVTLVDLATGDDVDLGQLVVRPVRAVASASDRFALATGEATLRILGRRSRRASVPVRWYHDVANVIRRDDRVFLGYQRDDVGYVVLDAVSGEVAFPPLGEPGAFSSVVLTPTGRTLSTLGGNYGALRVWRADSGDAARVPLPPMLWAPDLRTSVSDDTLAVSGAGQITVIDLADASMPRALMSLPSGEGFVLLQLGPRDERLASLSTANEVQLWNVADGAPIGDAAVFDGPVVGLGFIADGEWLIAWSWDSSFVVIDTSTGAVVRMLHPYVSGFLENGINDMKASSDGALLFSAGQDGTLRTWDRETAEEVAEAARHSFPLRGVAPSDDAERILTWGADTVTVWQPWSGSKAGPEIHLDEIVASAFWTRDNDRAAVLDGKEIRLFDPETALAVAGPWHHRGATIEALFVDQVLVTWTGGGAAAVWELDPAGPVEDWRPLAERVTGHALNVDQRTVESLTHDEHVALAGVLVTDTLASMYGGRSVPRNHFRSGFPSTRPLAADTVKELVIDEGWFDADLNPVGTAADVEALDVEDTPSSAPVLVVQPTRRVMWQAGGSRPLDLGEVEEYVRTTNATAYGGHNDWRLPRLAEAVTTLSPTLGDRRLHVAPGFNGALASIWTFDMTNDGRMWTIDYLSGRALPHTPPDLHHVRLVRDLEAEG
jgi:WD40 repeat protein